MTEPATKRLILCTVLGSNPNRFAILHAFGSAGKLTPAMAGCWRIASPTSEPRPMTRLKTPWGNRDSISTAEVRRHLMQSTIEFFLYFPFTLKVSYRVGPRRGSAASTPWTYVVFSSYEALRDELRRTGVPIPERLAPPPVTIDAEDDGDAADDE